MRKLVPAFLPAVIFTFVAQVLVSNGIVPEFILPAPSDVVKSLFEDFREYRDALFSTSVAVVIGLVGSFCLGTLIAILFSASKFLRRAIYPYAIFFQTVPVIAIAPLLVIWFGFGRPTVIVSAFIVSIFPIIANTLMGLESTDAQFVDLFRLYRATPIQTLIFLKIPSARPYIFSGLRIAAGLSVIGAIVGEFIAGGGLGALIDSARTQQRLDKVFAAVILASVLGLGLVGIVNYLSWLNLKGWHVSEKREI